MEKKTELALLSLVIVFLASCTYQLPSKETMMPTSTSSSQDQTTKETISPTVSSALTITSEPSATQTVQNTSTPTLVSPTLTPLPTLSPGQADKKVHELLRDNAGCRFPCWWGIIPGTTTWLEANHFLASFTQITPYPQLDKNGNPTTIITYLVTYPLENKYRRGGFGIDVRDDQIDIIFVGRDSTIYNLFLRNILSVYGPPNQIFLWAFEHTQGDDYPLILVLDYSHENFLVTYDLIARENSDELVSCPSNEYPSLHFWSAEEVVSEQRIQDWTLGVDPFIPMKPLEQVTDFNIATFTESFSKNANGSQCIRTRKEFWSSGN